MDRIQKAEELAFGYHSSGFHCTEAVFKAIVELYGNGTGRDLARLGTAFGAGFGRSHMDICGALSGAALAAGYLFGRDEPGQNWDKAAQTVFEVRKRFVREHGTTTCGALLTKFHPQENMGRCKRLSGEVAGMLASILEEAGKVESNQ